MIPYRYDAVLEVSGGPTRSPYDPQFDPRHITRVEVFARALETWLDHLDRTGTRYVSDGDPTRVARPTAPLVARAATPSRAAGARPAGTRAVKHGAAVKRGATTKQVAKAGAGTR